MSQTAIIQDLLRTHKRVTLRMMFDAGVGYTARNRISELNARGWNIRFEPHKAGEKVSDNAYVLLSEPKMPVVVTVDCIVEGASRRVISNKALPQASDFQTEPSEQMEMAI